MKSLRKGIAVFLLLLVVFPLMSVVVFHAQKRNIREAVKRAFKEKELSTIRVQRLNWYKADKEIVVDGVLFDVNTIELQSDGYYLVTGLFDHQEQLLHQQMDAATQSQRDLPLVLASAFCFSDHDQAITLPPIHYQYIHTEWNAVCTNMIPQFEPDIISPPPKQVLS